MHCYTSNRAKSTINNSARCSGKLFHWLLPVVCLFFSSCGGISSKVTKPGDHPAHELGTANLIYYFLPKPYIQVYAYKLKIGTVENLHYGIRSIGVADSSHPILLQHDYNIFREDNLQVSTSAEGLLERVALRRDPKVVETGVAIAKAVLSVMAPIPLPFKGDAGFPEFSKLVFKENFPLESLLSRKAEKPYQLGNVSTQKVELQISACLLETNCVAGISFEYPKSDHYHPVTETDC